MPTKIDSDRDKADFLMEVQAGSEQNLTRCYQCGNCTAGCPLSFAYDIPVSQIMRMLQTGEKHAVLSSKAIWLCASCETCTTRCPNEIDVARIMDVLRHMARKEGLVAEPPIRHLWDAFLGSVEKYGRVFEAGMMANFVGRTGRFWTDVDLAPVAIGKGKLGFRPHTIEHQDEVRRIFDRFRDQS